MFGKKPCVGFSSDAERQYRKVDPKLIVPIDTACRSLCVNCRGHSGESVDQITVEPWKLSWRCSSPGEEWEECKYRCRIVILDIARNDE